MFIVVNTTKFALNVLNLKNDSQKQLISNLNRIETQSIINPSVLPYFKINKMVFKTANVFDLIDHHQVQYCLEGLVVFVC